MKSGLGASLPDTNQANIDQKAIALEGDIKLGDW